jgi:N-acetylglucosamine kinase-like BadF-type ATPase
MSLLGHRPCRLAVGVDAGGTSLRTAVVLDGRRLPVTLDRAPALPQLATFLRSMWRRRRFTGRVDALVVATRGVWLPSERRRLTRELRGLARSVRVIADVEAAWHAAHTAGAGILILAGTGSIVLGRTERGRWRRAGGLGPLLGDEGSGFWIGRQWLRTSAPATVQRRFATRPDAVPAIAAVARRVIRRARHGDRTAARVVREAQAHLARQAHDVIRALDLRGVVVVSGAGSLMGNRWFAEGVCRALARRGVVVQWRPVHRTPADAAARLAAALSHGRVSRRG